MRLKLHAFSNVISWGLTNVYLQNVIFKEDKGMDICIKAFASHVLYPTFNLFIQILFLHWNCIDIFPISSYI